jgi:predicted lipid-binding transport protein (Tim44 family)
MKTSLLALIAVVALATIGMADAQAKKMGGGGNLGRQSSNAPMQRDSSGATGAAPRQAQPAQPAAPAAAPAAAPRPGAAPQASSRSRWMGPLAGLAAGLGLAALASHFGFGEALASAMTAGLLIMVVLAVVGFFLARRAAARQQPQPAYAGGYGMSGLGQEASVPNYQPAPISATLRDQPIDMVHPASQPVLGSRLPAGFDADVFVHTAKVCFIRLQAAYDAGNASDLREFTSPEMFAELKLEIDARNGGLNQTDVVTLEAELLGVESGSVDQLASVRFSGMLREEAGAAAAPFDEVWNFTRPLQDEGGWVLGGIQQLSRA